MANGEMPSERRQQPYDPVEWSRRLDQARAARARVIAAREPGTVGDTPYRLPDPVAARAEACPTDLAAAAEAQAPAPGPHHRIGGTTGFFIGVAAGALVVYLALV